VRHQRIKELFEAARCRAESERDAFLAAECGGDEALRCEVRTLLDLHDASPDFLREPALGSGFRLPDPHGLAAETQGEIPTRIGPYEIIGILGEGGMGTVYTAQQEYPRRTVALKVIRPGVASPAMLRRFEHEAQMLARLQHPGIAQIFEAGTIGGDREARPFFAMELVRGRPLTAYCDEHALGTRDRLALVALVCDAVHCAHQQGVVHRDLKPENILVDESAQPKILDFGVARATDSDVQVTTLRTDVGQLLGTVPYMSPEQVVGDSRGLDTRSDVYALGVVCYELLAGRLPLDVRDKTIPEAARIIQEADPTRLSSIDRALRGDVETIVGKALEKDKDRRYASASDLAADIRRYLADKPIVARPASSFYQLRKFTKRNKALVGAAVAVCAALVAGTTLATIGMFRAEHEARRARAVSDFFKETLGGVTPETSRGMVADGPLAEMTVVQLLRDAEDKIGASFAGEPELEAEVRLSIGHAYFRLGLFERAEEQQRTAMDLRRETLGEDDPQTLTAASELAFVLSNQGKTAEAEPLLQAAHDGLREALGEADPATLAAATWLAAAFIGNSRYAEAETLLRRTVEVQRDALGADDRETLQSLNQLARVCMWQGRLDEAEVLARGTLEASRRAHGPDDITGLYASYMLTWALLQQRRHVEAEIIARQTVDGYRRVFGETHPYVPHVTSALAAILGAKGEVDEAERLFASVLRSQREELDPDHWYTFVTAELYGRFLNDLGRFDESEPLLREAVGTAGRSLGPHHPRTFAVQTTHARALRGLGRAEEAESVARYVVETMERELPENIRLPASRCEHGRCLTALGRYGEAEEELLSVYERERRLFGPASVGTQGCLDALVALYAAWDRPQEAQAWREKLAEWGRSGG
jgi:tetratricopeptide (TPR) repeat protein/predicted Ser/Thr protein kinase